MFQELNVAARYPSPVSSERQDDGPAAWRVFRCAVAAPALGHLGNSRRPSGCDPVPGLRHPPLHRCCPIADRSERFAGGRQCGDLGPPDSDAYISHVESSDRALTSNNVLRRVIDYNLDKDPEFVVPDSKFRLLRDGCPASSALPCPLPRFRARCAADARTPCGGTAAERTYVVDLSGDDARRRQVGALSRMRS